jgi:uncharacterized protein (TIGR03083 family)
VPSLDFPAHIRADSARFAEVLRDADPAARVPGCPEWSAEDLLWHLTEVQWFWATIVAERRQSPPEDAERPARPEAYEALLSLRSEQTERLLDALAGTDPATPVWMWAEDKTVGYIRRRQAHEALIHRLDAEQTVGTPTPLDPVLATDGVWEALDVMYGGSPSWGTFEERGPRVEFRTADTGAVVPVALGWFTGTDPDGVTYDGAAVAVRPVEPAIAPAVSVRGAAGDLDAWLWHRADAGAITVEGDPEVYKALAEVLTQPID